MKKRLEKRGALVFFILALAIIILGTVLLGEGITGAVVRTNELKIMAAPSVSNLILNSTLGTNLTTENITAFWSISGGDGTWVKNITNWKLNGTPIAVLNMPFENISTPTAGKINATKDYSGFQNNGSEQNGPVFIATGGYDGKGAYRFDGVDDYINIGNRASLNFTNRSFTIELWAKVNVSTLDTNFVSTYDSSSIGFILYMTSAGALSFYAYDNLANEIELITPNTLSADTWYHLVAVSDKNAKKASLYINGIEKINGTDTTGFINNSDSLVIGYDADVGYATNATIDEVRIYNRSLSAEQIKALYENKSYVMTANETSVGDDWSACITPNDGTQDGTEVCSNNLTVLEICRSLSSDFTLTQNATSSGTCFTIAADNIILDCNGYTINYSTGGTLGYGVDNSGGFDNVTVRNCQVHEHSSAPDYAFGIFFSHDAQNGTIVNNSITATRNYTAGIVIENSSRNNLVNNTITTSSRIFGVGIFLNTSSTLNTVTNNSISIVAEEDGSGIYVIIYSPSNNFTSNTVATYGPDGHGIHLTDNSNSSILTNNIVTTNGLSAYGIGVWLSDKLVVENNTVTTKGESSDGIRLSSSPDSIAVSNTVITNGSLSYGFQITGSSNSNITNNTINTTGANAYGINLNVASNYNTLLNNNISANRTYEIYDDTGNSYTNYLVYNNSYGEIRWTDTADNGFLKDMDVNSSGSLALGTNLFIGNNTAALNTSAFATTPKINSSANITLKGLSYSSVNRLMKLDNYSTNSPEIIAKGTNCAGGDCSIISYNSSTGTLLFNTSNFSSFAGYYEAPEAIPGNGGGGSSGISLICTAEVVRCLDSFRYQKCLDYGTTNKWSETLTTLAGYQCKFGKLVELEKVPAVKKKVKKETEEIVVKVIEEKALLGEVIEKEIPPEEEKPLSAASRAWETVVDSSWLWIVLVVIIAATIFYFSLKKKDKLG